MDLPKTHRLIFSLLLEITPGPDAKPGDLCQLVVPVRRFLDIGRYRCHTP